MGTGEGATRGSPSSAKEDDAEASRGALEKDSVRESCLGRVRARGATLAERAVALCARIEADEKSLLVFGKESPVRTACVRLVENTSFQVFVFVVVMFNSAVLAMELPDRAYAARGGSVPLSQSGSWAVQVVFVVVFAFEAFAKVIAYGFCVGKESYLHQRTNIFDFVVVIAAVVDLASTGSSSVNTLRLLRTMQPLRALNKFKSGRMVLETVRKSVPLLLDVVVFMSWFVIVCTVVGMLLFGGDLTSRQYVDLTATNASAKEACTLLVDGYSMSPSADPQSPFYPSDDFLCARARQNELLQNGSLASPAVVGDTYCCDSRVAPVDGYVNFDDFSRGAFVVLQIMTVDGWNEVAWPTAVAVGGATAIPYYCMVVMIGGFFVLQLFTSVICATLSDIEDEAASMNRATLGDGEMKDTPSLSAYSLNSSLHLMESLKATRSSSFSRPNEDDIANARGIEKLRMKTQFIVTAEWFELSTNVVIAANTVTMMVATADSDPTFEAFRKNSEYFYFSYFCIEFAMKNFAFGMKEYWSTPFNRLDGFVVVVGVIDMLVNAISSAGGVNLSFLRILRVLRILRIARVFRHSRSFQKILRSVILSSQRIWVFLIVWVIFICIFAILGTQLFSALGEIDDERLNFRDFWSSVVTLFVVSTGENTFEVAWAIMKAAGKPAGLYMVAWCLITTSILALVLGILIDSITEETEIDKAQTLPKGHARRLARFVECMVSQYGFDPEDVPEWFTKKAELAFEEQESTRRKSRVKLIETDVVDKGGTKRDGSSVHSEGSASDSDDDNNDGFDLDRVGFMNPFELRRHRRQRAAKLRRVHEVAVVRHWLVTMGYEKHTEKSLKVARNMRRRAVEKARERLTKAHRENEARRQMLIERINSTLSSRRYGSNVRLSSISIRCIMTGEADLQAALPMTEIKEDLIPYEALFPPVSEADEDSSSSILLEDQVANDNHNLVRQFYGMDTGTDVDAKRLRVLQIVKHPWFDRIILFIIAGSSILLATETASFPAPGSSAETVYLVLDVCFNTCFTIEMCMKLFACGAYSNYGSYLKSWFNILDGFVVTMSWLVIVLGDALPIRSLRVVRILRPLRTVNRIKGLRVVVEAIMSSIPAISSVCTIGIAILTMLSVLGMELFLGRLSRCTLTSTTVATKAECLSAGGTWRAAKFNFDSFPEAFMTVFIIATGDNWQDIMFEAMDMRGHNLQPVKNNAKWTVVYFFLSILIAFLLWANLFVSALVDNFTRVSNSSTAASLVTSEQRVWQQAMNLAIAHADNSWRRRPPSARWKAVVHSVVSKYEFDALSVFMIVLNMVTVMMIRVNAPPEEEAYQLWMNNLLAVWYCIEAYLLIVAMKWRNYWKNKWNKVDFIVAISGAITLVVPAVYDSGVGGVFRMLRFLRLLKIVQVSRGLRTLLATFISSLPGVVNVAMLSLLFMYIYACLGVALFGELAPSSSSAAMSTYSSFEDWPKAMLALFVAYTGNWQGYFADVYIDARCYDDAPLPAGVSCKPRIESVFFFFSYVVLGVFFLGNLFIAIILDRFSFCASAESDESEDEFPLLYVTVSLQRVTREIVQKVRRANQLAPSRSGRSSTKVSSRRESGSNTPAGGTGALSAVESPSGELLSRASSQSARLPGSRSAADDIMDIFNVETAFEGSSSEKQSDTVVNGAADHMTLDFEQVKAALRRGLSNKGGSLDEKHVTAAANEVDRLVRSTSRSRSISRRRKESPSSGASNRDSGDENRSDDDEETILALQRQTIQQHTQATRGRPVVSRAHSQRARLKAASVRMGNNVVTSRYASSESEEDVTPQRLTQTRAASGGSSVDGDSDSSGDESFDSRL